MVLLEFNEISSLSSTTAGLSKLKVGTSTNGSCSGVAFGVESSGCESDRCSPSFDASSSNPEASDRIGCGACDEGISGVAGLIRSKLYNGARLHVPRGCLNSKNETEITNVPRLIQPMEMLLLKRNVNSLLTWAAKKIQLNHLFRGL